MRTESGRRDEALRVGRYVLRGVIGTGGMASVYFGRLVGPVDFSRIVAVKRLHPHLLRDEQFSRMFIDEARISGTIRHPNVVQTVDLVAQGDELLVVMEYVHGESLARLSATSVERGAEIPLPLVLAVASNVLAGLHAAHEAKGRHGEPLEVVHRDVSPQNVVVGADGVARLLDFGIAKAASRLEATRSNQFKGKFAYMAPEQLERRAVDRRTDVYAMGALLWEVLTGRPLLPGDEIAALTALSRRGAAQRPSEFRSDVPRALDAAVLTALDRDPENRWGSAEEFAVALERIYPPATTRQLGEWVNDLAAEELANRQALMKELEAMDLDGTDVDGAKGVLAELQELRARAGAVTAPSPLAHVAREVSTAAPAFAPSHSAITAAGPYVRPSIEPIEGTSVTAFAPALVPPAPSPPPPVAPAPDVVSAARGFPDGPYDFEFPTAPTAPTAPQAPRPAFVSTPLGRASARLFPPLPEPAAPVEIVARASTLRVAAIAGGSVLLLAGIGALFVATSRGDGVAGSLPATDSAEAATPEVSPTALPAVVLSSEAPDVFGARSPSASAPARPTASPAAPPASATDATHPRPPPGKAVHPAPRPSVDCSDPWIRLPPDNVLVPKPGCNR